MERAAKRDAQTAATSKPPIGKRQPSRADAPRPSDDEKAAFYADMVNSNRYLPANTISTLCAMRCWYAVWSRRSG